MSGGHPYSRQCDNQRGVTYFPVVRTYSNLSKRFTTSSGAVVCETMYGQSSLGYQAAGQAGPEDSIQQDTTNGAEGDGERPQSEQEADVQGFQGTDFSVHRLLPPPIAYSTHPLQNSDHVSTSSATHSSESHAQHMPQGNYSDPHASQPWVGYGGPYHHHQLPPSYSESGQRWTNHHHNSTSSDGALSPQPTNVNPSSHLHHPDNSGLYTLCEAAMISSNQQNSGYNYAPNQHPSQQPSLSTPPPPPPPYYYHHHMAAPYHSSVQHHIPVAGVVEAGSVTSPVSPNPLLQPSPGYTLPQSDGILRNPEQPGPSSSFLHQATSNGACDSDQPGPSYISQQLHHQLQDNGGRALVDPDPDQPGPSFLNTLPSNDAGHGQEQPGSSFLHQVPINNVQDSEPSSCTMEQQQLPNEGAAVHTEEDANFPAGTADGVLSPQDVEGQSGSSPAGGPGSMSEAAKPATRRSKKSAKQSTRSRTAFSLEQQDKLEMAYHINPYPDGFVRQRLSQEVGLPESRIQVWFQNRRARGKKQSRTGSISNRSKYRQRRLLVNLTRQAAILTNGVLPNAGSSPLDQAQNIGTAADPQQHYYYLSMQQQEQQQSSMASSANNRGDSQQSSQQETNASSNNGMSPDQNSLCSPRPDTQQFSPHYRLPSMAEVTAPTANSHLVGTAQNMNSSTVPPFPYYPSSVSAISMPPPPPPRAYNHTAGTATLCYLPHPTASLPPPAPHQGVGHGNSSDGSSSATTPSPNLPAIHSNPATLYYLPYPPPPPLPPPSNLHPSFLPLPSAAAVSSGNSSSPSPNLSSPYTTGTSTTGSHRTPSSDSSPYKQPSISPGQDLQDV